MNAFWNRIAADLSQLSASGSTLTGDALMEQLYLAYAEQIGADPPEIRRLFGMVDAALEPVHRELSEQLELLICRLCSIHQKTAFLDGITLGIQLQASLQQRASDFG